MSSLGRSEYPSAASSLHRRNILTSALSARSRSVWGCVGCRGRGGGGAGPGEASLQNLLFAPSAGFTLLHVSGAEGHLLLPEGGEAPRGDGVWVEGGEAAG